MGWKWILFPQSSSQQLNHYTDWVLQAPEIDSKKSNLRLWTNQKHCKLRKSLLPFIYVECDEVCWGTYSFLVIKAHIGSSRAVLYYLASGIPNGLRSGLEKLSGLCFLGDVFWIVNKLRWLALQKYKDFLCFMMWNFQMKTNVIWHFHFNAITSIFNVPGTETELQVPS